MDIEYTLIDEVIFYRLIYKSVYDHTLHNDKAQACLSPQQLELYSPYYENNCYS